MAITVDELVQTRVGAQDTPQGAINYMTLWKVSLGELGQSPIRILRDRAYGWTGTYVPIGRPHPWNSGVVAQSYQVVDQFADNPFHYTVMVVYGPAIFLPTLQKWTLRIRSSVASENVFFDLDRKGIGTPNYGTPIKGPTDYVAKVPKYALGDSGERYFDPARGSYTFDDKRGVYIYKPPGKRLPDGKFADNVMRYVKSAERKTRAGGASISRETTRFDEASVNSAHSNTGKVNNDKVNVDTISGIISLASSGTIMQTGFTMEPMEGFAVGQQTPNVLWKVGFEFEAIGDNVHPYTLFHTYNDPLSGTEAPIFRTGANESRIEEDYRMYEEAKFSGVIGLFSPGR